MELILPYPGVDPEIATEIFEINEPLFYYRGNENNPRPIEVKEINNNEIILSNEWTPDKDLIISWVIKLKSKETLAELFHGGKYACVAPETQLGIAVQWYSWSSHQRNTIAANKSFTKSDSPDALNFSFTLGKSTLRGEISFSLILYVVKGESSSDYPIYTSESGAILGKLSSEYTIKVDGSGSAFPIFNEIKKGEPLWRLEYNIEDPTTDSFQDTVRVWFNKADTAAFSMLDGKSPKYNKFLLGEIKSEILIELFERVRAFDPNFFWDKIGESADGSVGAWLKYLIDKWSYGSTTIDCRDISSLSSSIRHIMHSRIK